MFTTEQLRLRAYKDSDFEPLLNLHNYEEVAVWLYSESYITPQTEDKFKENGVGFFHNKCALFCVAEELEGGAIAGIGMLFHKTGTKNRDISFGISVTPQCQNKGYGGEITQFMVDYAFHNMGMHRVSLTVFGGNEKAARVYKRVGFVEEARVRKALWARGVWHDQVKMGILYEDWCERRPEFVANKS